MGRSSEEWDTSLSVWMERRLEQAARNVENPPDPPKPSRTGWDVLYHAIEVVGLVACAWALVAIVWLAK